MAKVPFKRIRERAAKRKDGEKVLASLMPKKPNNKALRPAASGTVSKVASVNRASVPSEPTSSLGRSRPCGPSTSRSK